MPLVIAVIMLAAAVINIAAAIIKLHSDLVNRAIVMAQRAPSDSNKATVDKTSDARWVIRYLLRKQKSNLFVLLVLLLLPYIQYRLTGILSFTFFFLLVHSAIFFWAALFMTLFLSASAAATEERQRLETGRKADEQPRPPPAIQNEDTIQTP